MQTKEEPSRPKLLLPFILLLVFALSLSPLLAGCSREPAEEKEKTPLSLLTGGSGSRYASLGQDVAERVNARSEEILLVPELSAGLEANLRLLAAGRAKLAIVSADLVHYAREEGEMFSQNPIRGDVTPVARLGLEPLYLLGTPDSPLKDAGGLKGKTVSLGQGGSRTQILAYRLLKALELDLASLSLYYLVEGEALKSLEKEELDAAFCLFPLPIPGEGGTEGLRAVPFTPGQEKAWQESLPFAVRAPVPAGTFSGQEEGFQAPAIPLLLAAARDLEPEILRELQKALIGTPSPLVRDGRGTPAGGRGLK